MAIRKGIEVNGWEVMGRIGSGGMASVWKVRHKVFGEERALKAVHANLLKDSAGSYQRFLDEAINARKVVHPNVVQVFDAGVFPDPDAAPDAREKLDTPWLVMELFKGHDLAEEMKQRGAEGLPREEVASIMDQVGAGVGAAHAKKVLHLDLKPENLFLAEEGERRVLKVVDFGISKTLSDGRNSITLTQRLMSPQWTSPEQIDGQTASPAADVWAIGLIAFYLLTGRFYWHAANKVTEGKDPINVLFGEILRTRAEMPKASQRAAEYGAASRLPDGFDAWFARCTLLEPTKRFHDATECCGALLAVLRPVVQPPAPPSPPPPPAPEPPPAPTPSIGKTEPMPRPREGLGLPPVRPLPPTPEPARESPPPQSAKPRTWYWIAAIAGLGVVALAAAIGPFRTHPESDAGVADVSVAPDVPAPPPPTPPPPAPRCPDGMVLVPEGTFTMGSDGDAGESDERPAHRVHLSAFCIDRTEVTVRAYHECVSSGGCTAASRTVSYPGVTDSDHRVWDRFCNERYSDRDDHPINCVDWAQAVRYCASVDKRLPTEAQWEYAAHGEDGRVYPWGDDPPGPSRLNACGSECLAAEQRISRETNVTIMDLRAMYPSSDGFASTAPVGRFPLGESPFHALDMAGNVLEWTADWYGPYTSDGGVATNPTGVVDGTLRVLRGGGWLSDLPSWVRAANRNWYVPALRSVYVGFRCARGVM